MPSHKKLPKFAHVPLAVIHPTPAKQRRQSSLTKSTLTLSSSSLKLKQRPSVEREIPEHLQRMPADQLGGASAAKPPKVYMDTRGMTSAQKKKAQEQV